MRFLISLACLVVLLNGCSAGMSLRSSFQGSRLMEAGDYRQGESTFRDYVAQNPQDPVANYYLGRFLLAQNKAEQALPYLKHAVSQDPKNADYLFWQGVALGEIGNAKLERQSYQRALAIDERHVQALTYLGHNQLRGQEYQAALLTYNKVLEIWPTSPSALYNRALIARIQNRTPEEKAGWLAYLRRYRAGELAIRATDYLNQLGNFDYQNQDLGGRIVTLPKIWFEPFSDRLAPGSTATLDLVGAAASNIGRGKLQVVVFQQKDHDLAKARALSIRRYLMQKFPGITPEKIGISWFGEPEDIDIQGKKLQNPQSVRFFFTGLDKGSPSAGKKKN